MRSVSVTQPFTDYSRRLLSDVKALQLSTSPFDIRSAFLRAGIRIDIMQNDVKLTSEKSHVLKAMSSRDRDDGGEHDNDVEVTPMKVLQLKRIHSIPKMKGKEKPKLLTLFPSATSISNIDHFDRKIKESGCDGMAFLSSIKRSINCRSARITLT